MLGDGLAHREMRGTPDAVLVGMPFQAEKLSQLRELVKEHQVVYEVRRFRVGFDVDLYGTHSVRNGRPRAQPGCPQCEEVWEHLHELAVAALPPADRESGYEIRWFRPALIYDPKRQPRADVELTLEIRHRGDGHAEIDACEKRCRDEIVAALRSLGAREGTWTARGETMGCCDGRSRDPA
jgi:hypothetical protein